MHYNKFAIDESITVTIKRRAISIIHQLILAIDLFQQVALHQKKTAPVDFLNIGILNC
jgi:hypothetical protein